MKLFAASLATETNTFAPIPTNRQSYTEVFYARPGEHPDEPRLCTAPLLIGRRRALAEGWTLVEGSCAWAEPSGPTAKATYEEFRDEILDQLRAAMPVDGVLMGLHGAMVAYGYDDCEGDLLERVRAIVGQKAVIGVEHDPHCHLTKKRLAASDILITFKEFPHIDTMERGAEVVELTLQAINGKIKPVKSVYDCHQIASYPTTRQPMRGLVDKISAMEGKDGILSISIAHGFPYGDVPELGTRVLVITDDRKAVGDRVAREIGEALIAMRGKSFAPYLSIPAMIDQAYKGADKGNGKPVVVADPTDNPGGGAAGDSTYILRALIDHGAEGVAFGPIWDPQAVRFCFMAGEGARLPMRIGGKTAPTSGQPIDAEVEILRCVRAAEQSFGPNKVPLGDAAAIRIGGIEIALITNRTQALGTELFTGLGIELPTKRLICLKSTNHFHAAYAPLASDVLYCEGGGPLPRDLAKVGYTKLDRPLWPMDPDASGELMS